MNIILPKPKQFYTSFIANITKGVSVALGKDTFRWSRTGNLVLQTPWQVKKYSACFINIKMSVILCFLYNYC